MKIKYLLLAVIGVGSLLPINGWCDSGRKIVRATIPSLGSIGQELTAEHLINKSSSNTKRLRSSGKSSGGYWSSDGNMVMDNLSDPNCIFFLNYSDGNATQSASVRNVTINCY